MRILFLSALIILSGALAAADAVPGVYQQYKPQATPEKSATPIPSDTAKVVLAKETVAFRLNGGAALAIGETGKYNTAGFSAGGDMIFKASADLGIDLNVLYASMAYKNDNPEIPNADKPLTVLGVSAKFIYVIGEMDKVKPYLTGGLGYFFVTRAVSDIKGNDPLTGKVIYGAPKYKSDGGMGFGGGLGAAYAFTEHLDAHLAIDITSVSLSGGTGDNVLFAAPNAGFTYTF